MYNLYEIEYETILYLLFFICLGWEGVCKVCLWTRNELLQGTFQKVMFTIMVFPYMVYMDMWYGCSMWYACHITTCHARTGNNKWHFTVLQDLYIYNTTLTNTSTKHPLQLKRASTWLHTTVASSFPGSVQSSVTHSCSQASSSPFNRWSSAREDAQWLCKPQDVVYCLLRQNMQHFGGDKPEQAKNASW